MPHAYERKKRPVRGKAQRQEYISNKNKKTGSQDDISLTGMIQAVSDEVEAANDEMSITRMIAKATGEAADKAEVEDGDLFGSGVLIQANDKEEEPEKEKGFFRSRWVICLCVALAAVLLISGISAVSKNKGTAGNEPSETAAEEVPSDTAEESAESHLIGLQDEISAFLSDAEGNWSVYLKDLKTNESFVINDEQMPSASLIKLFTAGRYLEALENGEIYETESSDYWLTAMISWSDNDAWEALETHIGQGSYINGLMSVTDFAQRIGCERTGREIGTESIYDYEAENLTAASEVGYVLESIYKGTYISAEASARLYDLMYQQSFVGKIPAGLPEGFEFASKSGELPGIENDAAIIKGPDTDYVLVVLANDFYYSEPAVENIVEISAICAHYLNPSIQ